MKKHMKRIAIMALSVMALISALCVNAGAARYEGIAEALSAIGMFRGTDKGFELDRAPTRSEAAIMLVRLYGAENEANAAYRDGKMNHPFKDVSEFTSPYVAWLYANGITKGVTPTTFNSQKSCTLDSYLVFLLRVLGYQDGEDFQYADARVFAEKKGIGTGGLSKETFLRDDLVALTYRALAADMKSGDTFLLNHLIQNGWIDGDAASALMISMNTIRRYVSVCDEVAPIGRWIRTIQSGTGVGFFCAEDIRYDNGPSWRPAWLPDGWSQEHISSENGVIQAVYQKDDDQDRQILFTCAYPADTSFLRGFLNAETIQNMRRVTIRDYEAEFYTETYTVNYPTANPEVTHNLLTWENNDGTLFFIRGANVDAETLIRFAENLREDFRPIISWKMGWMPEGFIQAESSDSGDSVNNWLVGADGNSFVWMYSSDPITQPERDAIHVTVNGAEAQFWTAISEMEPVKIENRGGTVVTSGFRPSLDSNVLAWTDDESGVHFQIRASLNQDTMIQIANNTVKS